MEKIIRVARNGRDAIVVAAEAARQAGTRLAGNMRWATPGSVRVVPIADGRVVRVYEHGEQFPPTDE